MITSPKLEERYIVLKIRDLKRADALAATREFLRTNGIKTIDCVVVEADWPQYRTVVDMIIPDQSQQSAPHGARPLYAAPQPVSDDAVRGLVEALEVLAKLGNGKHYSNSVGNVIAQIALSDYRAAMGSKGDE